MTSVLVVGAGLAGLTAAYRLQQAGFGVTVIEAADIPGGRMAERYVPGSQRGDIAYNTGARLIYPFGRALPALLRELGLAGACIPVRDLSARCRIDGHDHHIALMPGISAMRMPGLTAADRLRLAALAVRLVGLRRRTDPDDIATATGHDNESLAAWADRMLGPRLRARLIDPVFRGTRSWDADEISAAFLLSTLPHMLGRRDVHVLAGGMGRLTGELAGRLDVRLNTPAVTIERAADGAWRTRIAGGRDLASDLVVIATEGAVAAALLSMPEPEEAAFLGAVRYNSLGIVHYALSGDVLPAMRFIDRREGGALATFQQLPAAPTAGRPHAQLYCQLTPEASRAAVSEHRIGAIEAMIHDDVRRLFPDLDRRSVGHAEQWIAHKLPTPYPGYVDRLARFRIWQAERPRSRYFCGDYLAQPLLNGACASGEAVARLIARHHPARQDAHALEPVA